MRIKRARYSIQNLE